jgi:hypothetical protein
MRIVEPVKFPMSSDAEVVITSYFFVDFKVVMSSVDVEASIV